MPCHDPSAANFDPNGISTGGCIYVKTVGTTCYTFEDLDAAYIKDRSFTLSYAIDGGNWVFFHDYIPNFYFHTRNKLMSNHGTIIQHHNSGDVGQMHPSSTYSFFIDVVFVAEDEATLNAISWATELFDRPELESIEFDTLSHITIWNEYQTTGRISISKDLVTLLPSNSKKERAHWEFNDFRDRLLTRGSAFLLDIFNNFAVDTDQIDDLANNAVPWYERKLMEDKYFVIRFEFDNVNNYDVILHDADIDVTKSYK